jgi:hypothetical protein
MLYYSFEMLFLTFPRLEIRDLMMEFDADML